MARTTGAAYIGQERVEGVGDEAVVRACMRACGRAGVRAGAHDCVAEEVLLEEGAAAALGDVPVRHPEHNAQQPHIVHAR